MTSKYETSCCLGTPSCRVRTLTAIDPVVSLDGESVDLRIHSAPGFTYTVEVSKDLATRNKAGDPVTATSASLTFELDPSDGERLFLRARRSP